VLYVLEDADGDEGDGLNPQPPSPKSEEASAKSTLLQVLEEIDLRALGPAGEGDKGGTVSLESSGPCLCAPGGLVRVICICLNVLERVDYSR
jgi:hypothetical protein